MSLRKKSGTKREKKDKKRKNEELRGLFDSSSDDTRVSQASGESDLSFSDKGLFNADTRRHRRDTSSLLPTGRSFRQLDGMFKTAHANTDNPSPVRRHNRSSSSSGPDQVNMKNSTSSPSLARRPRRQSLIGTVRGPASPLDGDDIEGEAPNDHSIDTLNALDLDEDSPKKAFNKKNTYLALCTRLDDFDDNLCDIVQALHLIKSRVNTISDNQRTFGQRQNMHMDLSCNISRKGKYFMTDLNSIPYARRVPEEVPRGAHKDPAAYLENKSKASCLSACTLI